MKMITKDVARRVPALYSQEGKEPSQVKVPLKFFNPCGAATWYITEANFDEGVAFGWCDLGPGFEPELGYVNLNELFSIKLRFGLKIERDLYWDPNTTLAQVKNGERR